ncbi:hypothetical protein RI367_007141 [Sorochytrium milnesiophthora]
MSTGIFYAPPVSIKEMYNHLDNIPADSHLALKDNAIMERYRKALQTEDDTVTTAATAPPKAVNYGARGFSLAYAIRAGVSILQRLLAKSRNNNKSRLSTVQIILHVLRSGDTVRLAAMFGLFPLVFHASFPLISHALGNSPLAVPPTTSYWEEDSNSQPKKSPTASYTSLVNLLRDNHYQPLKRRRLAAFLAGILAGYTSFLPATRANRLAFSQQMSMRALQAIYNMLKSRDMFHFPLGDSLLFVCSCAQIMYSYILYPQTLPPEFYSFMINMAKIPRYVLQINRESIRGGPVDVQAFLDWMGKKPMTAAVRRYMSSLLALAATSSPAADDNNNNNNDDKNTKLFFPILPCQFLHPHTDSCTRYCTWLAGNVFRKIFPVYCSLHLVPTVLLKLRQFVKNPSGLIFRALLNTIRSCTFLAVFVSAYQSLICLQRNAYRPLTAATLPLLASPLPVPSSVTAHDSKHFYFLFGALNALSILIEDKRRRSELGLYTAPKAIHSLYLICSQERHLVPRLRGVTNVVFAASMGVIMAVYETEPQRLSPMVARVMPRFL